MFERRDLKVLISRPRVLPAVPCHELRRPDFCWTRTGELLTLPDIPCADADECGCGRSFAGVTSARATSWGVVELRSLREITSEIRDGDHLAGWSIVENMFEHILDSVADISRRIRLLPLDAVVGIWALDVETFALFDRTPAPGERLARLTPRARRSR